MAWRNLNKKYIVRVQLLKLLLEFVVEQGEVVIGFGEEIEEPIYCLMLPMLLFCLAIIRTHHHRRNLSHTESQSLSHSIPLCSVQAALSNGRGGRGELRKYVFGFVTHEQAK